MQQPSKSPRTVEELWRNASALDDWTNVVLRALAFLGGEAALADIYTVIAPHPRAKIRKFWKDKVRQKLESYDAFVRVSRGQWGLADGRSKKEIAALRELRASECPPRPRVKNRESET